MSWTRSTQLWKIWKSTLAISLIPATMRLRMEVLGHTCVGTKVESEWKSKVTPYDPRKHLLSCRHRDQNWFGPPCTETVPPRNCTFLHFQTNCRQHPVRPSAKAGWIFPDICKLFIEMNLMSAKLASFFPVVIYDSWILAPKLTWPKCATI